MIENLVHFPNRETWRGKDVWILPSHVAALWTDGWSELVFTNVELTGGGMVYIKEYAVPEVAKMLGLSSAECGHGVSGLRCDDCYAALAMPDLAIADRPKGQS